jgi:pSer/pThr/pTyr-binding forkhead associated (FHA) protein
MSKQLVVITGGDKGKVYVLPESGKLIVGRSKETDTKLTDARVSRKHCHVEVEGERIVLVDADSTEGTFVNDKRVRQQQLFSGDVIRIGNTEMRFEDEDAAEAKTIGALTETAGKGKSKVNVAEALTRLVGTQLDHFQMGPSWVRATSAWSFAPRTTTMTGSWPSRYSPPSS